PRAPRRPRARDPSRLRPTPQDAAPIAALARRRYGGAHGSSGDHADGAGGGVDGRAVRGAGTGVGEAADIVAFYSVIPRLGLGIHEFASDCTALRRETRGWQGQALP